MSDEGGEIFELGPASNDKVEFVKRMVEIGELADSCRIDVEDAFQVIEEMVLEIEDGLG